MAHSSIRIADKLWNDAGERAKERGFASRNEYVAFLIKQDLETTVGLEQLEASMVASISKVAARVTSLGTMHQAMFAVLWALAEEYMRANPAGPHDRRADERIEQFRAKVAGEIRGNSVLKEVIHGEATPTAQAS